MAETALREMLLPMAALLTPNLPEAETLAGFPVRTEAEMRRAAEKLRRLGAKAVLMKGGHLEGDRVVDLLFHEGGSTASRMRASRSRTRTGTAARWRRRSQPASPRR
jgi:hydroxymethylpyrimidine/phosphomethylpyrimidine kinase